MGRYKVQWDYTSSYGTYEKGDTVEVDEALAEALDRDSPGVLRAMGRKAQTGDEDPEESPEEAPDAREATVPADRQQRRRRTRS